MSILPVSEIARGISHLFYPRLCEGCSRPLLKTEKVLCMSCIASIPETGYTSMYDNDTVQRFAGRVPFVFATSYAWFTDDGLLQHLLHGLKYKGKKETGLLLGELLGQAIITALPHSGRPDLIIPVPLHKAKEAKRGYNQSALLAQGINWASGMPVINNVLVRKRNTESQTCKTRAERLNNMADAFEIREKNKISGKHILLCDDVLTTGATLEACALALLEDRSVKISFATIGIAAS